MPLTFEQIAQATRVSSAATDVLAERLRQTEREGFTSADDDAHTARQMALGAYSYIGHYVDRGWVFQEGHQDNYRGESAPWEWPWEEAWWKPKSPREDLVRAAALIIAEIERLDREASHE